MTMQNHLFSRVDHLYVALFGSYIKWPERSSMMFAAINHHGPLDSPAFPGPFGMPAFFSTFKRCLLGSAVPFCEWIMDIWPRLQGWYPDFCENTSPMVFDPFFHFTPTSRSEKSHVPITCSFHPIKIPLKSHQKIPLNRTKVPLTPIQSLVKSLSSCKKNIKKQ